MKGLAKDKFEETLKERYTYMDDAFLIQMLKQILDLKKDEKIRLEFLVSKLLGFGTDLPNDRMRVSFLANDVGFGLMLYSILLSEKTDVQKVLINFHEEHSRELDVRGRFVKTGNQVVLTLG